jgi:DNA repair exonuclease SbcCD ATPase subunit
MNIRRVILKNVGVHEYLDITFSCGLIGVVGYNGKGKSTLISSCFSVLSNDWTRLGPTKEDCIRIDAPADAEASVQLLVEHHGEIFEIYGALRPPKGKAANWLDAGGHRFIKVPDIQRELKARLGINRQVLDRFTFVSQSDTQGFLVATPAERAEVFQRLNQTEKSASICKAIDKAIQVETAALNDVGVVDNSDEILKLVEESQKRVDVLEAELAVFAKDLLNPTAVKLCNDRITQFDMKNRLTVQIKDLRAAIDKSAASLETLRKSAASKDKLVEQAVQMLDELRPLADEARHLLAAARQADMVADRRFKLEAQLDKLAKIVASRQKPALDPADKSYDALISRKHVADAEFERAGHIVKTFADTGLVECPECGTPVSNMHDHLKKQKADVARLDREISMILKQLKQIEAARAAVDNYNTWKSSHEISISGHKSQLVCLTDMPVVPVDQQAAANQAIQDYEQQGNITAEAKDLQRASTTALRVEESKYQSSVSSCSSMTKELLQLKVTVEERNQAITSLEKHNAANLEAARCKGSLNELRSGIAANQQQLDNLKLRLERGKAARAFIAHISTLRDTVFHYKALPNDVAQANLRGMEAGINESLTYFGSPFWVEASDDLTFLVHEPSKPPLPAASLSGGFKGILAISFRLSLSAMFGGADLLVLDEPTSGLDRKNVTYLAEALKMYANRIRGQRQVIMVTHAVDQLASSFDQLVQIGPLTN